MEALLYYLPFMVITAVIILVGLGIYILTLVVKALKTYIKNKF